MRASQSGTCLSEVIPTLFCKTRLSSILKKGQIFVFSGPSGAGKTSLLQKLLARHEWLELSVSYTTRPSRKGERNGREYYFVDDEMFQTMVDNGDFLEHARVFGFRYGTSKQVIADRIAKQSSVALELDWQGAKAVRECFDDAVSVFILPPSKEHLQRRLEQRQQDSSEVISNRMKEAMSEMEHCDEFDYVVVNDDFEIAHDTLESIIREGVQDEESVAHSRKVMQSLGLARDVT